MSMIVVIVKNEKNIPKKIISEIPNYITYENKHAENNCSSM